MQLRKPETPGKRVTDEVREEILARPEPFEPLQDAKAGDVIQVTEASSEDLAAISAPIHREGDGESKASHVAPKKLGAVSASSKPGSNVKPLRKRKTKSGAQKTTAVATQEEQQARSGRKVARRGIRLKAKLPGKKDLGLG